MKQLYLSFVSSFVFTWCCAQQLSLPPSGDNQKASVTQYLGAIAHVTVNYSSPDVNGRTGHIWGELVPYGLTDPGFGLRTPAPWRAGANENTTITFSHDVLVEGKHVLAGTYGVHMIVEATGPWTWILSKNSTAWGSFFYKPEEDALRVQVNAENGSFTEWLTYEFTERKPDSAKLVMRWENIVVPMQIAVFEPAALYTATLSRELENSQGFRSENWAAAANYLVQQNYNLELALKWADFALNGQFIGEENFTNLQTKSMVLLKMGKKEDANLLLTKAIQHSTASAFMVHGLGRQLIADNMKDVALHVFEQNYQKMKGAWPTNVGMARGLSAVGRYDEALKYAKLALAEAPDQVNKDSMSRAITRLEKKEDFNL